jgi:hypothetical protein
MTNCEREDCRNYKTPACRRCMNYSLYRQVSKPGLKKERKSQKEGMSFQRKVQQRHDSAMSKSRQCLNSGALWFDPGDIITERDLIECKERKLNSRGEKSFTITKEIINKIEEEAGYSRSGIVAFGFKGDDEIYCIAKYDLWLALIQENESLKNLIKEKDNGL